jgi:hypothetical protein
MEVHAVRGSINHWYHALSRQCSNMRVFELHESIIRRSERPSSSTIVFDGISVPKAAATSGCSPAPRLSPPQSPCLSDKNGKTDHTGSSGYLKALNSPPATSSVTTTSTLNARHHIVCDWEPFFTGTRQRFKEESRSGYVVMKTLFDVIQARGGRVHFTQTIGCVYGTGYAGM